MRTKRAVTGQDWEFDGKTITVHIPMTWKRRGGRKVIIAPDGGDAWAPAKPRHDETLIRALARAHRWKRLIEDRTYRSAVEIAEAESVTSSFVNRVMRLTLLAPDIQEAIFDGRHPTGLQLNDLARLPNHWGEQRKRLMPLRTPPGECADRQERTLIRDARDGSCASGDNAAEAAVIS